MADNRKTYEHTVNGITHTVKLDADDAERLGDAVKEVKSATPANKAKAAENK